jgi:hypothetical protein
MDRKKGASHLEIILAFTIFTAAVVTLFVFLNPTRTDVLVETSAIYLKDSFLQNVSTDLTIVFVNGTGRCAPGYTPSLPNWTYRNVSSSDTHYYAHFSDEFEDSATACNGNVEIGSITRKKVLSNKSLKIMEKAYNEDYEELKTMLNVPKSIDFEIYSQDGEYSMKKDLSLEDINIIAKTYRLEVLYSNGSTTYKNFVFRTW